MSQAHASGDLHSVHRIMPVERPSVSQILDDDARHRIHNLLNKLRSHFTSYQQGMALCETGIGQGLGVLHHNAYGRCLFDLQRLLYKHKLRQCQKRNSNHPQRHLYHDLHNSVERLPALSSCTETSLSTRKPQ